MRTNLTADIIKNWARENGIEISPAQLNALLAYQERVLTVNKYMNLTAITDEENFAVKHFIDSLTLLPYVKTGAKLIDIGTGAGFPGMVLRIMRDDLQLTLLDSLRKRIIFLRETWNILNPNDSSIEFVHARAEDFSKKNFDKFEICTARAVANLEKLAAYALPLLKEGGIFLAMKGPDITAEIKNASPAIKKYGGLVEKVDIIKIAENLNHSVVVIRKYF
jgi:16S rRNA (guanine527-N7)-methyltransferase